MNRNANGRCLEDDGEGIHSHGKNIKKVDRDGCTRSVAACRRSGSYHFSLRGGDRRLNPRRPNPLSNA